MSVPIRPRRLICHPARPNNSSLRKAGKNSHTTQKLHQQLQLQQLRKPIFVLVPLSLLNRNPPTTIHPGTRQRYTARLGQGYVTRLDKNRYAIRQGQHWGYATLLT